MTRLAWSILQAAAICDYTGCLRAHWIAQSFLRSDYTFGQDSVSNGPFPVLASFIRSHVWRRAFVFSFVRSSFAEYLAQSTK